MQNTIPIRIALIFNLLKNSAMAITSRSVLSIFHSTLWTPNSSCRTRSKSHGAHNLTSPRLWPFVLVLPLLDYGNGIVQILFEFILTHNTTAIIIFSQLPLYVVQFINGFGITDFAQIFNIADDVFIFCIQPLFNLGLVFKLFTGFQQYPIIKALRLAGAEMVPLIDKIDILDIFELREVENNSGPKIPCAGRSRTVCYMF